jgi:tetratricopeptide (TPR) repeat protein
MASFSGKQWAAIGASVIFFASLFFINRKPPKAEGAPQTGGHNAGAAMSIDSVLQQAEAQVPFAFKNRIEKLKGVLQNAPKEQQVSLLDSIINICDSAGAQVSASYYLEKLANIQNTTAIWYEAGDSYYKCAEVVNNAARVPLLTRSIQCFDNALKVDSNNLEAKVGKGECIVQGAGNPMEGIKMIEGVLKRDSNNEKATIALGTFSIQSGQFPKAIARFKKVLKIDPTFTDAYVYLAQASEGSGDKMAAIGYLKKYSTFARDSVVKIQVNDYIKKLEGDTTGSNKSEK